MKIREIKHAGFEWIDLVNPKREDLQSIASKYNLNYYTLTDSLEPNHLPKFEIEDNINFFIVRIIHNNAPNRPSIESLSNKIAVFYNDKIIISIHRVEIPFLDEIVKKYIETNKAQTTNSVVIKLLWYTLQTYNTSIISVFDKIETYENNLFLRKSSPEILSHIYLLKRKVNLCTKFLFLTNEIINSVKPSKQEKAALQDTKDFHVKLATLYEQVNEDLNNLLNLYISLSSQKTNETMKTLTIFSIFFMPLTFIAGIYGMNFRYMPELEKKWGYPCIMVIMIIITVIIYYWLKRKKWL